MNISMETPLEVKLKCLLHDTCVHWLSFTHLHSMLHVYKNKTTHWNNRYIHVTRVMYVQNEGIYALWDTEWTIKLSSTWLLLIWESSIPDVPVAPHQEGNNQTLWSSTPRHTSELRQGWGNRLHFCRTWPRTLVNPCSRINRIHVKL